MNKPRVSHSLRQRLIDWGNLTRRAAEYQIELVEELKVILKSINHDYDEEMLFNTSAKGYPQTEDMADLANAEDKDVIGLVDNLIDYLENLK